MAGKIPPWVIPSVGSAVRNSHESWAAPPRMASNRMKAKIAMINNAAKPVIEAKREPIPRRRPGVILTASYPCQISHPALDHPVSHYVQDQRHRKQLNADEKEQ